MVSWKSLHQGNLTRIFCEHCSLVGGLTREFILSVDVLLLSLKNKCTGSVSFPSPGFDVYSSFVSQDTTGIYRLEMKSLWVEASGKVVGF